MKILGIDPGNTESGYVIYEGDLGRVYNAGVVNNEQIMVMLSSNSGMDYQAVAMERIAAMGMAVGETVFETVFWTGRFYQEAMRTVRNVIRVKRSEVKMHLCNSMQAKDSNIRQALIDRLGAPGTKKAPGPTYGVSSHAWSALAVAVTAADKNPGMV